MQTPDARSMGMLTDKLTTLRSDRSGTISARRLPARGGRRLTGQDGYILAMTALMILPLMVFVSFAVDLGSWYAQASRMQRAADAAALAAVVHLPNTTAARNAYIATATANGYTNGTNGVTITGGVAPGSSNRYRVTITDNTARFFSGTFNGGPDTLNRSSTAEFNKPVPLGSPTSSLGNDVSGCLQFQPSPSCTPVGAPAGSGQPMLWSTIQGPYELFANGDPYTTKCARNLASPYNATTCSGSGFNTLYKNTGYGMAIDVKAGDLNRPLTLQVWDATSQGRQGSFTKTSVNRPAGTTNRLNLPSGQTWLDGNGNPYGERYVFGPTTPSCIPAGTYITGIVSGTNNRTVTLSQNITCSTTATFSVAVGNAGRNSGPVDCVATWPPFNAAPYNGTIGNQNCQTGDSGATPLQVQIYDNDGVDLQIDFNTPLTGCELYVPPNADRATYMNTWVPVCTFTPTRVGVYPIRIKSSNITRPNGTVITDTGSGYNSFSLRVRNGSANATNTRLYAIDDLSIWTNTPASDARFYLAEILPEHAGKRLLLDLYDPGDGNDGTYTMQVLAPPSGSPRPVPNLGTSIPATNIATSCRYNPTESPTKGPDVRGTGGQNATACTVTTRNPSLNPANKYNNHWLRIEIALDPNYNCGAPIGTTPTDCWWTIKYNFGTTNSIPTDRTVWSITVVGDPVHLVE